jgi:hypothetical protein
MAIRVTEIGTGILSATVAAVGTLAVGRYNKIGFSVTGLSTETLTIQMSFDGGATWTTGNSLGVTPVTGAAVITTVPSTSACGYYANLPPCTHIKFVKSAAAQTVSISYTLMQN